MADHKNSLIMRALRNEETERPPVWLMRQAGRYLPEYMELRGKYGFLERCYTPEIATEITLQPLRRLELDAGIIFSDICSRSIKWAQTYFAGKGAQSTTRFAPPDLKRLRPLSPEDDLNPSWRNLYSEEADVPILVLPAHRLLWRATSSKVAARRIGRMSSGSCTAHLRRSWTFSTDWQMRFPSSQCAIRAGAAAVQLFDTWEGS